FRQPPPPKYFFGYWVLFSSAIVLSQSCQQQKEKSFDTVIIISSSTSVTFAKDILDFSFSKSIAFLDLTASKLLLSQSLTSTFRKDLPRKD
ncbi:hypothetical protein HAX54_019734, partial [Datura stramonium]|nr:hypothetical protein [Datura stramonium]